METSQTRVTRAVRKHMADTGASQAQIGSLIGRNQPAVSDRLNGKARWSLDDVDYLRLAGVSVPLDHAEVTPL